MLADALAVLDEDAAGNRAMGERGADLLAELCGTDAPIRVHTHCNAGALGLRRVGHRARRRPHAARAGPPRPRPRRRDPPAPAGRPPHRVGARRRWASTSASSSTAPARRSMSRGETDAVIVGADRIAANGDVANKIGTYSLALAAARAGIPFVVAAPESTIDPATPDGASIPIEDRGSDEVTRHRRPPHRPRRRRRAQPRLRRHPRRPRDRHRHRGPHHPPCRRRTPGVTDHPRTEMPPPKSHSS